ncbi:Asp-tRNA(Asn)/Glu-tRNA(Gln) amidotransferase subunit GatB [Candidatus Peribacteria bacterium]|jgi:aspartyl-tRNA(Asn)/glutamyl-tRNA(Gln) amidotransferase subunit B|nr:Asp-tRNA(Asn)/Glu-tRNA(Gln) amidotransferase subunit GatB [Candidatus Peribacteria bacterium]MBT4020994.1 Asp-tRNA(Asn)/Glu-tRNA(Gln) amidotransferase subunit GatB [Candidatus Peribacteria bacterium]MBT4240893.1 Asp-tRNA(Asn)/Glu-tRNA(Gln) amidotransferase subunit GatB [Candidatus Peribacteria bacterium]MBT4474116.1 Asp-tRNA(Asn)/Glu-tRNA(Gln) amidotransferase subunit GatB [Candidatus Peribacteria bacterium]
MKDLEVIIGLEVHAQMNTKTKMFCGCDNDAFGKAPNTTVCPICMGHPGTLPVTNEEAIKKAIKAALALKCEIAEDNHLDRKNYFYPDLPMGFQISQYDYPISKNGCVEFIDSEGKRKECRITRLHIENDAGKLQHAGGRSYCDYNRAGTPLMEIVTEPDLKTPQDAVSFAKELQKILISVNSSEADMYKGMMRFDASVSLRPKGEKKLYPRSEIKNLNSFKSLEKALIFEIKRLGKLWEEGSPQDKEVTVHWDDDKEVGVVMREKESSADYRYFPEPDIPPLHFEESEVSKISASIGEMPEEKRERYLKAGLSADQAMLLAGDPRLSDFFDEVVSKIEDYKRVSSVVLTQLMGFLKSEGKELSSGPSVEDVISLLKLVDDKTISANSGKVVLEKMVKEDKKPQEIIKEENMQQISNSAEIENFVQEAVKNNPQAVQDFISGNEKAKSAIIGFVMGKTKGQADPRLVDEMVVKLVKKG